MPKRMEKYWQLAKSRPRQVVLAVTIVAGGVVLLLTVLPWILPKHPRPANSATPSANTQRSAPRGASAGGPAPSRINWPLASIPWKRDWINPTPVTVASASIPWQRDWAAPSPVTIGPASLPWKRAETPYTPVQVETAGLPWMPRNP